MNINPVLLIKHMTFILIGLQFHNLKVHDYIIYENSK